MTYRTFLIITELVIWVIGFNLLLTLGWGPAIGVLLIVAAGRIRQELDNMDD